MQKTSIYSFFIVLYGILLRIFFKSFNISVLHKPFVDKLISLILITEYLEKFLGELSTLQA